MSTVSWTQYQVPLNTAADPKAYHQTDGSLEVCLSLLHDVTGPYMCTATTLDGKASDSRHFHVRLNNFGKILQWCI